MTRYRNFRKRRKTLTKTATKAIIKLDNLLFILNERELEELSKIFGKLQEHDRKVDKAFFRKNKKRKKQLK